MSALLPPVYERMVMARSWIIKWTAAGVIAVGGCASVEKDDPIPIARPNEMPRGYAAKLRAPIETVSQEIQQASTTEVQPAAAAVARPENAIDLDVALRLAGADNPTAQLARERIREAQSEHLAARALLLPTVNVGGNFYLHRGAYQAPTGQVMVVDRQSLYLGAGGRAVGSGTVAFPGVRLFAPLADAAYEPVAARQRVAARRSDAAATQNAVLLDVASAYLELVGVQTRLGVLRHGETELAEVARLTAVYAKVGQGRRADASRAEANLDLLRREIQQVQGEVDVAAARVCRLLNLDPSVHLRPLDEAVQTIRLMPDDGDLEALVAQALLARPELPARAAEIQEAQTRTRQERVRPLLPTISVGYSAGLFGGGSKQMPPEFGPLQGRSDFDAVVVWNVQNLGFGNRARVRGAEARVGQAVAVYDLAVNQVRREVAEALAAVRTSAQQIATARASLFIAEEGFDLEMRRIKQGGPDPFRPVETLDSFRQLLEARQDVVRAIVAYDIAQFRLFVAVGNNPLCGSSGTTAPLPAIQPDPGKP